MTQKIEHFQKSLHLKRRYVGFQYAATTLELFTENKDHLLFLKPVFSTVAEKYHVQPHCIERDIRTIINRCWTPEIRPAFLEISPVPLMCKPTVSEFLNILYWYAHQREASL